MTVRRSVLGLGSNLGSREALIRAATAMLSERQGIEVRAHSRVWRTPAIGPPQPDYLNAAVLVESGLDSDELWRIGAEIERALGRERRVRWGPRTLDIDVLWTDRTVAATATVTVPHPELLNRRFALAPLLELVPDAVDPRTGARLSDALNALSSQDPVPEPRLFGLEPAGESDATPDELESGGRDRVDALATALVALVRRGQPRGPVRSREAISFDVDGNEVSSWLAALRGLRTAKHFAIQHVVVFEDNQEGSRGAAVGETLF